MNPPPQLRWATICLLALAWSGVVCAQNSKSGRITPGTFASRQDCPSVASAGDIHEGTDQNRLLTPACDAVNGWISRSGGANLSGNQFELQGKNGGLAPSRINDNQTTAVIKRDAEMQGPNPFIDIRIYGARWCGNTGNACPSTKGTISASSRALALAAASTFKNGDGIRVSGAGPTISLSTPAAPGVIAGSNASAMGTNVDVANTSGTSTFQYQVVTQDTGGGYTAASAVMSISNGPNTWAAYSVNVSSCKRSNGTVTINTSTNHGLVQFEAAYINGIGCGATTPSLIQVATVPSGTQFTFNDNNDSRAGAATSGGASGTVTAVNVVHLGIAHQANALRYCIYGRTSGAMNLIGYTLPDNPSGNVNTDPLYNTFDDYGPAYTPNIVSSSGCPLTPPARAKNDDLVTTITAGAGTTSVTLATSASNSVSAASTLFDNTAPFQTAAYAAAHKHAGVLFIPATPQNAYFVFQGYVDVSPDLIFPGTLSVMQAGAIATVETIHIGSTRWVGWPINPLFSDSFFWETLTIIQTSSAYPMLWSTSNVDLSYIALKSLQSASQAVWLWLHDGNTANIPSNIIAHVGFASGAANPDSLSVHYGVRSNRTGDGHQIMEDCAFTTGNVSNLTTAPLILFSEQGENPWTFSHIHTNRRTSVYFGGGTQAFVTDFYTQGSFTPDFIATNVMGGTAGLTLDIHSVTKDTTNTPLINYLPGIAGHVTIDATLGPQNIVLAGPPGVYVDVRSGAAGSPGIPNLNSSADLTAQVEEGILTTSTSSNIGVRQENREMIIGPPYKLAVTTGQPAAPGLVAGGSGGTISAGSHTFTVAQVFSDNGEGPQSPPASVTVTSGQNVTITATPLANGIGWDIYEDAFSIQCAAPLITPGSALNFTWTGSNPARCGQSAPNAGVAAAGPNSIDKTSVNGQKFTLVGTPGYMTSFTNPNNNANQSITWPNASGTPVLDATFNNNLPAFINGAGFDGFNAYPARPGPGLGASWTQQETGHGTVNIITNGSGVTSSSSKRTQSAYTGISFPSNQWAQVLSSVTGNSGLVVRGTTSGGNPSGYVCLDTVGGMNILRASNGSFTSLVTNSNVGANGDTIWFSASDSTLTCIVTNSKGASAVLTATDSAFTTGAPGVSMGNTTDTLTNFIGGGIANLGEVRVNGSLLTSVSGNSNRIAQSSGTLTASKIATFDNNGNVIAEAGGGPLGITFPTKTTFVSAVCNNATPATAWSLPRSSAPTPNCNTGGNIQEGTLDFADGQSAQFNVALPGDWTSTIDARVIFFNSSTSGTVIFDIATACQGTNGRGTDDVAFNTANAFGKVTVGTPSNEQWEAEVTGITTTGCSAGNTLQLKLSRATDTASGLARVKMVELTIRRAL